MTNHGTHDSLVWQALEELPVDAHERGVTVAPCYRRSPVVQFEAEAERLLGLRDPGAPVWRALAESKQLAERLREMDPDYAG